MTEQDVGRVANAVRDRLLEKWVRESFIAQVSPVHQVLPAARKEPQRNPFVEMQEIHCSHRSIHSRRALCSAFSISSRVIANPNSRAVASALERNSSFPSVWRSRSSNCGSASTRSRNSSKCLDGSADTAHFYNHQTARFNIALARGWETAP